MRNYPDWLQAYLNYADYGEAPRHFHFWSGVSAVAGALQRKVWIDQGHFRWYPNFYLILVAPPGVVSKSTTAGIAMKLLKQVKGVRFGPSVVTWQALVSAFAGSAESFTYNSEEHVMSALSIFSSELGNLINPEDRELLDMFVNLWDGEGFSKVTKNSGSDDVQNPWINILGATTPSWIASNFSEYTIGGGFTSRCLFIYAEDKIRFVGYPVDLMPKDMEETSRRLVEDLTEINKLKGPFILTPEAKAWGQQWYEHNASKENRNASQLEYYKNYVARKQTHTHKLAMVLSASTSNSMIIDRDTLQLATDMVTDLESDMKSVFRSVGQSKESVQADKLLSIIRMKGELEYQAAYRQVHLQYPSIKDFEDVLAGCVRAGYLKIENKNGGMYLVAKSI